MATFDMPAWMFAAAFDFGIQKSGAQFKGPFNGTIQAGDFVADRWVASITLPGRKQMKAGEVEAFFNRMAGGVNRVRLLHLGSGTRAAPYAPRGTLRGAPTLAGAIARGNASLPLANCGAGATVWAGDMVGCNGQLYMAADSATANGAGAMTLPVVNRVRAAAAAGTAVIWNKPTADFVMPALIARHVHVPGPFLSSGQFDLEEAY